MKLKQLATALATAALPILATTDAANAERHSTASSLLTENDSPVLLGAVTNSYPDAADNMVMERLAGNRLSPSRVQGCFVEREAPSTDALGNHVENFSFANSWENPSDSGVCCPSQSSGDIAISLNNRSISAEWFANVFATGRNADIAVFHVEPSCRNTGNDRAPAQSTPDTGGGTGGCQSDCGGGTGGGGPNDDLGGDSPGGGPSTGGGNDAPGPSSSPDSAAGNSGGGNDAPGPSSPDIGSKGSSNNDRGGPGGGNSPPGPNGPSL